MAPYALFFRGLNVGGRRLAMADLRDMLTNLGFTDVTTILQTGSAVLRTTSPNPSEIEAAVESAFVQRFGYQSAVHARSVVELGNVVIANPFPDFALAHPNHLLVYFGARLVSDDEVRAVQEAVTGPELLAADGREIYVTFPDGIGVSTLPRVKGFGRLVGDSTARNWNTLVKVLGAARRLQ